jgi:hypothetical protein
MSDENPKRAAVRGGKLTGKTPEPALTLAEAICTAGAGSADVQGSPVAKEALDDLDAAVTTAKGSLQNKANLAVQFNAAIKALDGDMDDVREKLKVYERAINSMAGGDAAVIANAGLDTRAVKAPPAALGPVEKVDFRPGKAQRQAILSWPEAPGAGSYAIELNFNLETPDGPWTQLVAASNRSRVVEAPAPGVQFLARVAAVGHDGTMSPWTRPVLVTAR